MDLGVSGRNFVIVGGTTGMGFAAATALAGDGANVALLARDGERATQRADTLAVDHGVRAVGIVADGTNRGDLADAIDRAAYCRRGDQHRRRHRLLRQDRVSG